MIDEKSNHDKIKKENPQKAIIFQQGI